MNARNDNGGFTLIEVMVAVVVLAVGLLGMASLMVRSQQSNEGAYSRSQASILAYDIIERMRRAHEKLVQIGQVAHARARHSAWCLSAIRSAHGKANSSLSV